MSKIEGISSYNGGKNGAGVYQTIINHIRPHDVYVEPFLGSGGVLTRLKQASTVIGCDTSEKIVKAWQNTPKYEGVNIFWQSGIKFLQETLWNFWVKDASIVIYCDPPYPHQSRRGGTNRLYAYEWGSGLHLDLLRTVNEINNRYPNVDILISTYPNDQYQRYLQSPAWFYIEFQAMTRKGLATERLYMNYDPKQITELHDYSYLGGDYRERENLTRQLKRMDAKLGRMPVLQRNKILSHLNEKYL